MSFTNSSVLQIITQDATPTPVSALPITSGSAAAFVATIVAIAPDGTAASWNMSGLAKKVGQAAAVIVGSVDVVANPKDMVSGWNVTLDASDDSVVAILTGDAAKPLTWTIRMDVTVTP
jgi:hypothetical protein